MINLVTKLCFIAFYIPFVIIVWILKSPEEEKKEMSEIEKAERRFDNAAHALWMKSNFSMRNSPSVYLDRSSKVGFKGLTQEEYALFRNINHESYE